MINNLADVANGGRNVDKKNTYFPIPGKIVKNNIYGTIKKRVNIQEQLVDPRNLDFRPLEGSQTAKQDIGPYKYNSKLTKYWIPGRQEYKASIPVPKDGSTTVIASRRDTLMWL